MKLLLDDCCVAQDSLSEYLRNDKNATDQGHLSLPPLNLTCSEEWLLVKLFDSLYWSELPLTAQRRSDDLILKGYHELTLDGTFTDCHVA